MRINNVEIFATGKHNGKEFTVNDLNTLVESYKKLDYKPAIKLGHTDEPGAQAFGYLINLRVKASKLIGDLTDLPEQLYNSIKDKRYGRVSLELFQNLERGGRKFKYAVKAIALLGQEIGAVHGLKPLTDMFDTDCETVSFDFKFMVDDMEEELKEEIARLKKKIEDLESDKTGLKEGLEASSENHSEEAKALKFELEESTKRILALESATLNHSIKEKMRNITLPSLHPAFETLYRHALKNTDTVKMFSVENKKHEDVTLEHALDSVITYLNDKAGMLFSEASPSSKPASKTYDNAASEVDNRVKEYLHKHDDKDYEFAMKAVLAEDAQLKEDYLVIN